jgi:hypothetical protein
MNQEEFQRGYRQAIENVLAAFDVALQRIGNRHRELGATGSLGAYNTIETPTAWHTYEIVRLHIDKLFDEIKKLEDEQC